MPYPQRYCRHKPRERGRRAKVELALTIIVIVAVIPELLILFGLPHASVPTAGRSSTALAPS
jgi:hypothetical protein